MKPRLSKEEIAFYAQRRKQYTKDFKELTNQFKPKLISMQKLLIARKHGLDEPPRSLQVRSPRKTKQVLANLTKSLDIQNKMEQGMERRACKYKIEAIPDTGFNYLETCSKIQNAMVPLIQKLDQQIIKKKQEIQQLLQLDEDLIDPRTLQHQRDSLEQMMAKDLRLRKIIQKLSQMQYQTEEKIYRESIKKLEKADHAADLDPCLPFVTQESISRRQLELSRAKEKQREEQEQIERLIRKSIEEEIENRHRLDVKIHSHFKQIGLSHHRKLLSQHQLQEYLDKCKEDTQKIALKSDSQMREIQMELKNVLSSPRLTNKSSHISYGPSRIKSLDHIGSDSNLISTNLQSIATIESQLPIIRFGKSINKIKMRPKAFLD